MDELVFSAFHNFAGTSAALDWLGIVAAQYLPWGLAVAALVLVFRDSSRIRRLESLIALALALLVSRGFVTEVIRYAVPRPRPFAALGFEPLIEQSITSAFPSGHAAIFFALAVMVWFINRRWGWWFGALALVNGIARVYVGVHWPTDILAGAVVGILSALAVKLLLAKMPKERSRTSAA